MAQPIMWEIFNKKNKSINYYSPHISRLAQEETECRIKIPRKNVENCSTAADNCGINSNSFCEKENLNSSDLLQRKIDQTWLKKMTMMDNNVNSNNNTSNLSAFGDELGNDNDSLINNTELLNIKGKRRAKKSINFFLKFKKNNLKPSKIMYFLPPDCFSIGN